MVNPGICQKCECCSDFKGVGRDDDGRLCHTSMISCSVEGCLIDPGADIPDGCLYRLEHTLLEEDTRDLIRGWKQERQEQADESGL